jgi:hypothetical protein
MSRDKKKRFPINLGDQGYYKKLFKGYSWFFPIVLILVSGVFFYDGALITGGLILVLAVYNLPPVKKLAVKLPRIVKIIINIAIIALIIASIGLYV